METHNDKVRNVLLEHAPAMIQNFDEQQLVDQSLAEMCTILLRADDIQLLGCKEKYGIRRMEFEVTDTESGELFNFVWDYDVLNNVNVRVFQVTHKL